MLGLCLGMVSDVNLSPGAGDVAQATVGLDSSPAALSLIPSVHINWAWWCRPVMLALRKRRQEDFQAKAILGMLSWRPA